MVTAIFKTGKVTQYTDADEVKTEQSEYIILQNGSPVGQVPRENVEQFMFSANQPKTA